VEGDLPDTTRPAYLFENDPIQVWATKNDVELQKVADHKLITPIMRSIQVTAATLEKNEQSPRAVVFKKTPGS